MIICPGCGADMHFDPKTGKLTCDYCGTAMTIAGYRKEREQKKRLTDSDIELTAKAEKIPGDSVPDSYEVTVFTCPQCGAALMSTDETAVTFCSYCGSSVALEGRLSREKRPDKIIPFSITKEQCQEAYRKLLGRSLFVPSEMKTTEQIGKFRGIYMPYWIYNFTQMQPLHLIGKKVSVKGDCEVTERFDIHIPGEAVCSGIAFDASSIFYDNLSEGISPFSTELGVDFDPAYLSGFYADTGDVDPYAYIEKAGQLAEEAAAEKIAEKFDLRSYSINKYSIEENLQMESRQESGMFPVWFLSTRMNTNRGKKEFISYAVVNGQTGKITAELPVDFKKYLLGSVILAVLIFVLLNFISTPTPGRMLTYAGILAAVGIFISNAQINRIWRREKRTDDIGLSAVRNPEGPGRTEDRDRGQNAGKSGKYLDINAVPVKGCLIFFVISVLVLLMFFIIPGSGAMVVILIPVILFFYLQRNGYLSGPVRIKRKEKKEKVPFGRKIAASWKQLAALVVIVAVIIVRPVSDYYYFAAALMSLLLTAWSFYNIVTEYNQLTTHPIPQLGKRGGDKNE